MPDLTWCVTAVAVLCALCLLCAAEAAGAAPPLVDKTLVVWVAPGSLDQRGGSALTIEDPQGRFDGVVFGELAPRRWMPGSEGWVRSAKEQGAWPRETAGPDETVRVAIVYRGREVTLFRGDAVAARYAFDGEPLAIASGAVVVFGRRHTQAADRDNTFVGRIRDARIYDRALDAAEVSALRPGTAEGGPQPWAWWSFADEGLREKTGRFTHLQLVGGVRQQDGWLVLPGEGASLIATAPGDGGATVPVTWSAAGPVPDAVVQSARQLRERFLADPWRPRYHFCVPEDMGEPGDPNGAFYHNGRYHLMYLYNRSGSGFCWGHISSADLVHWRHHPDAIGPGGSDEGCFSGGGFVDEDGAAYLSYWMLWGDRGIGIARSEGPPHDAWLKSDANPVIRSTEFGVTEMKRADGSPLFVGSADPSNIWKRDGRYWMLTGNLLVLNKVGRAEDAPASEQGDRLYLFESPDLKTWTYRHVFYERKPEWTDRSEDNMCPSFLPLPSSPEGGKPSGKHLLLFISHNKGCQYYVGKYRSDRFEPEAHGRMTWVDNTYFAPEALIDGRGRQIMWAWLLDNPGGDKEKGWSGVFGLPRTLWLGEDGTLRMAPVPELAALRLNPRSWPARAVAPGSRAPLEGIVGDSFELELEAETAAAGQCGVRVCRAPDGSEETLVYYDAAAQELVMDTTRSGVAGRRGVERAPLALKSGERLKLRVFVDRSVIEVYANEVQAICRRVFPGRADSLGVALFAEGQPARFRRVRAWEMAAANPF